ncbi:hypothetical protein CTA1_9454 [Colletotrichum tanaceti]|uniref:Uncharacterized protein n=1 Tax=Colletotrichum tanaceti TaxID=1306861 RepID=A0A4U6X9W1_9PEZI|nr:hypothetical protein CTA1_9454 [Colletotrichum tanaceti]
MGLPGRQTEMTPVEPGFLPSKRHGKIVWFGQLFTESSGLQTELTAATRAQTARREKTVPVWASSMPSVP